MLVQHPAIKMDMVSIRYSRWLEILRYFNHLMTMDDERAPKPVVQWDIDNGGKGWINDEAEIARILHLPSPNDNMAYD